jgi:hypothetical protein
MSRRSKKRQSTLGTKRSLCGKQMLADLHERDIRRFLYKGEDLYGVRLDPPGAPVATLRTSLAGARLFPLPYQFDHSGWRDAETGRGRPAAHALLLHGPDDATAQIQRERFGHGGWPPAPAPSVNHDLPIPGNPPPIPSDRKML